MDIQPHSVEFSSSKCTVSCSRVARISGISGGLYIYKSKDKSKGLGVMLRSLVPLDAASFSAMVLWLKV